MSLRAGGEPGRLQSRPRPIRHGREIDERKLQIWRALGGGAEKTPSPPPTSMSRLCRETS